MRYKPVIWFSLFALGFYLSCTADHSTAKHPSVQTNKTTVDSIFIDSLIPINIGAAEPTLADTKETPSNQKRNSTPLPQNHKYQLAKSVLDRLWKSAGSFNESKPTIKIISSEKIIAQYKPGSHVIELEQNLFDVCASFDSDSLAVLAFVIGHELAHVFQMSISSSHPFLAYDKQLPSSIRKEKIADIHGIFLAYLSGYLRSGDIVPTIIKRLYDHYNLKKYNLIGYDDFSTRKLIAEEVKLKADTLRHVFEFANHCTRIGLPKLAEAGYRYVLTFYKGAEIYHNLALCNAFSALSVSNKQADLFIYPFALETQTNLTLIRAKPERLTAIENKKRQDLLQLAIQQLDSTLRKNPQAILPRIHQASILSLAKQSNAALDKLSQINRFTLPPNIKEKVDLTKALVLLSTSNQLQQEQGKKILQHLSSNTSSPSNTLARFNLSQIENTLWEADNNMACPMQILQTPSINTAINQFHLYNEILPFDINEIISFGWSKDGPNTRWIGYHMGTEQLNLLTIKTNTLVSKSQNSWLSSTTCPIWIEDLRSQHSKSQAVHIVEKVSRPH